MPVASKMSARAARAEGRTILLNAEKAHANREALEAQAEAAAHQEKAAQTELEYTIEQNVSMITANIAKMEQSLKKLREEVASGQLSHYTNDVWVRGFMSQDVTETSALLAKHQTYLEVQRMISK